MTIIHDPERRRSTHLETGLAVQWVRDEPPMERQTHFKLIADGIETPFVATYDYGEPKLKARYPNMSALEFNERMGSVQEKNFHAINLKRDFDRDWALSSNGTENSLKRPRWAFRHSGTALAPAIQLLDR